MQVWTGTKDGVDELSSLKEKNIGALYLGSVNTPFDLNDDENNTNGVLRSTGICLTEEGGAGTIQQNDLVTSSSSKFLNRPRSGEDLSGKPALPFSDKNKTCLSAKMWYICFVKIQ